MRRQFNSGPRHHQDPTGSTLSKRWRFRSGHETSVHFAPSSVGTETALTALRIRCLSPGRHAILDVGIILAYFAIILGIGLFSRVSKDVTAEEYFLSSRSLRWPTIAMSTIATNIQAGHFMGMAGSAYIYGLAQANLEINAIFGIVICVFFFVPLFIRMRAVTITQFFESKFGPGVALAYSTLMIALYGILMLGGALYWAAYAVETLFVGQVGVLGGDVRLRLLIIIIALGMFSAFYTYLGGLTAVVRTDVAQLVLLLVGGVITVVLAIQHLGGWDQLWEKTPDLMHLHLPANHDTLPWTAIIGMNLLNLNYWGANQVILQRALAAKDKRHAQLGLLVGGVMKYVMAIIVIVPGIALAGMLLDQPLKDPDAAYATLVNMLLPPGLRGLILCGLFASLMSTVDSIFNSISTMWSIDIYKRHLRPDASDADIVRAGKRAIIATLITGVGFAFVMVLVKYSNPDTAFTHWFNQATYFIKNGFVLLILSAAFLYQPSRRLVLAGLLASVPLTALFTWGFADMNYFVSSGWVILLSFGVVALPAAIASRGKRLVPEGLIDLSDRTVNRFGALLLGSLVLIHIVLS